MKNPNQKTAKRELRAAIFRKNKLRFAVALILLIVTVGATLLLSWFMGQILDTITSGDLDRLWRLGAAFLVFTLCFAANESIMYRCKAKFIHKGLAQYKEAAFARISQKSIAAFARENTGRYISVLTNDASSVEENYLNRTLLLVFHSLLFLGAFSMVAYYCWQMIFVILILGSLPVACSVLLGKELTKREKAVSDGNEKFVSQIKDLLTGFSVVKAFRAETEVTELFQKANREIEGLKLRRRWMDCIITVVNWDICASIVQFSMFFFAAYLAIRGEMTAGTVLIITNLGNFILQPIQQIPQFWATRKAAVGLMDKLAGLITENEQQSGQEIAPVLRDAITVDHVGFAYDPEKPVLEDVNLRFEAGKSYAIVGSSGSGKSTLLNLLMGSYADYAGKISVDGTELRDIAPESLYELLCLMQQNVFIFDSDIRSNVTMFRDFPEASVDRAMALAGLTQLVQDKGDGYRCGENGVNLSGGEKQRIAIARCLLRNAPVLLMDEATASLDAETSYAVTDAILNIEGLTRIMVTHRLEESILRRCDGIVVMRHGKVAAVGTFDQLMEKKGYFYSLYTVANFG